MSNWHRTKIAWLEESDLLQGENGNDNIQEIHLYDGYWPAPRPAMGLHAHSQALHFSIIPWR